MPTKAGFVAIVGFPNAGKSTLMNAILGTKLSIVTRKAQTTRKKVLGIFTEAGTQIVFLDNPGLIEPKYELQKKMMEYVEESFEDSDIILVVLDSSDLVKFGSMDIELAEKIRKINKPTIAVLNKIDLLKDIRALLPVISELSKHSIFSEIVPISAKKKSGTKELTELISKYLPDNDFFYDEEFLSIQNERFFVSELIREQLFKYYSDEIPYSAEVEIDEFKEREAGKWYVSANIIVERSSQKKIIIGENGSKIKELGERSRRRIEQHLEFPVYLKLFVKVKEKWRKDSKRLTELGY